VKVSLGSKDYEPKEIFLLSTNGKQGKQLTKKNEKFYHKVMWDKFTPERIEDQYYESNVALIKLVSKVSGVNCEHR